MVYGLWSMVYGLWSMVYGLWSMVYGLWSMVYGLWSMVYGNTRGYLYLMPRGIGHQVGPLPKGRGPLASTFMPPPLALGGPTS